MFVTRKPTMGPALAAGLAGLLMLATSSSRAAEPAPPTGTEVATFAGGCFWCMTSPYENLPGVLSVTSGYTGGDLPNPTYEQVSSGGTGHLESVQIVFDPEKISYDKLLYVFWRNIDPLNPSGQFCDLGEQYHTAIFYHDAAQKRLAEESKKRLEESKRLPGPIVTEIRPASVFYPAEDYHQNYCDKNPVRYKLYRWGCGRDRRLKELWGAEAGGEEKKP